MRSRSNSTFTAILLLIPLLAVPFFAVFGIPQVIPGIGPRTAADPLASFEPGFGQSDSGPRGADDRLLAFETARPDSAEAPLYGSHAGSRPAPAARDPFAERPAAGFSSASRQSWQPPDEALNGWQTEPVERQPVRQPASDAPAHANAPAVDRFRADFEPQHANAHFAEPQHPDARFADARFGDSRTQPDSSAASLDMRSPARLTPVTEMRPTESAAAPTRPARPVASPFAMASDNRFEPEDTRMAAAHVAGSDVQAHFSTNDRPRPRSDAQPLPDRQEPLTWLAAARRLEQLGIRQYRLVPGRTPQLFLFVCSYTPEDDPRITHRFEAEASEPLHAVEQVLVQVDQWMAAR